MKFPEHRTSLFLIHNEHKNYYKTTKNAVEEKDHGYIDECWISEEEKRKAIETDECWTMQWYPNSTVGFCIYSAATLDALLAFVEDK